MARIASPLAALSLVVTFAASAHADTPKQAAPAAGSKPTPNKSEAATPAKKPAAHRGATAMHSTPIAPEAHAAPTARGTTGTKKPVTVTLANAPQTKKADKPKPPCLHEAVSVTRGVEETRFSLTRCDGSPAAYAVAQLSILARPSSAAKPTATLANLEAGKGPELAPGIKKLDPALVVRLQQIADHFKQAGRSTRVHLISGYRPTSEGSFHASGKALDFRLDGVTNEQLVAFCKTLPDAGCGYYPNSSFIHLDVRPAGTGHIAWIDASGPGESPRYVSAWPPPPEPTLPADVVAKLNLPELPVDEHPADVKAMGAIPDAPPPPEPVDSETSVTATRDSDAIPVPAETP